MNGECVRVEHMADIDQSPLDDPRRRHLETCPRCRAQYAAYRDFMTLRPADPGSDPERARAELEAALEREMGTPSKVAGTIAPRRAMRWAGWAAAAAAILAVSGVIWVRQTSIRPADAPILRGPATRTTLVLASPSRVGDAVELSWTSEPAATAYEVVLYDDAMREVLRVPTGAATVLRLTRPMLGERAAAGTDLAWRVVAMGETGELGRSSVGTFAAP
jgi:hypothetical protein